jgi:ankyrin repeat protein
MQASFGGHRETVVALLEAGADVNVNDREGRTALMLAKNTGRNEIVQLLKEAGAQE